MARNDPVDIILNFIKAAIAIVVGVIIIKALLSAI